MPGLTDLQLMAHLFRRAGFGATRDELEAALAKGYAATVEELLHPEVQPRWQFSGEVSRGRDSLQVGSRVP